MVGVIAKAAVVLSGTSLVSAVAIATWRICYPASLVLVLAAVGNLDLSGRWIGVPRGACPRKRQRTGTHWAALNYLRSTGLAIGVVVTVAFAVIPITRLAGCSSGEIAGGPIDASPLLSS